ncbi:MAG: hypothetical protein WCS21_10825 [Lachnospiraceae bacterium]
MSERILIARNYDDGKPYPGIALKPNEMPVFGCNKKEIFCKYANAAGYCTMLTGDCSAKEKSHDRK